MSSFKILFTTDKIYPFPFIFFNIFTFQNNFDTATNKLAKPFLLGRLDDDALSDYLTHETSFMIVT